MKCPLCGKDVILQQKQVGTNENGEPIMNQYAICKDCKKHYTLDPKTLEYPEEIKQQAIKVYYVDASDRGVGMVFGFNKANVYNWIKKRLRYRKIDDVF